MANSREDMLREDQEALEHARDIIIRGIPIIVALMLGVSIGLILAGIIWRGL